MEYGNGGSTMLLIFPTLLQSTCGTASEVCDARDNDGDGVIDEDLDLDGYSACATAPQPGDCDDSDPTVQLTALEYPSNEKDDDCDVRLPWRMCPCLMCSRLHTECFQNRPALFRSEGFQAGLINPKKTGDFSSVQPRILFLTMTLLTGSLMACIRPLFPIDITKDPDIV